MKRTTLIGSAFQEIERAVHDAELVVLVTPLHYGGYAAQLKKAVDRLLPLISPFFRKAGDMTHHAMRYEHRARALLYLRVAAAAAGLQAQVEPWPDAADTDLLARVRLAPSRADQADAALQAAMAERRTYRKRFSATAVDPMALRRLVDAVRSEAASLAVLDTADQRLGAAALVAGGDAMLWANPSWRRERAAWMHPRRRGDGLTLPALAIPVAQMVVRTFDMGHGVAAKDRQLADESPVLAVLLAP